MLIPFVPQLFDLRKMSPIQATVKLKTLFNNCKYRTMHRTIYEEM